MNLYAQKLNAIEYKVNRIYNILLLQSAAVSRTESTASHSPSPPPPALPEPETPTTPLSSYKFDDDDLRSLHLSHYGYAFRHDDQTRHSAIDKAIQRHSKDKVLKHLYAIWCVWEKRDSNYENTIKKDVVYVEGK